MRGKAAAIAHAVSYLAIPLLAFISYLLIPVDPWGVAGWRWVVLVGSTRAIAIWWLRLRLPESPRWLAQCGQAEAAQRIVAALEIQIESDLGRKLLPPQPAAWERSKLSNFNEVWQPPYRQRTIMLMVFNFFQTVGFFGFTNWLPTLLTSQGQSITKSLLYSAIVACVYPLCRSFGVSPLRKDTSANGRSLQRRA
jgi:putative MFS transporter